MAAVALSETHLAAAHASEVTAAEIDVAAFFAQPLHYGHRCMVASDKSAAAQVSVYQWAGEAAAPLMRVDVGSEVSEVHMNDDCLAVLSEGALPDFETGLTLRSP